MVTYYKWTNSFIPATGAALYCPFASCTKVKRIDHQCDSLQHFAYSRLYATRRDEIQTMVLPVWCSPPVRWDSWVLAASRGWGVTCNDIKYSKALFQVIVHSLHSGFYKDCQCVQSWEEVKNVFLTEDTIKKVRESSWPLFTGVAPGEFR